MKKVFKLLITMILLVGVFNNPLLAQTPTSQVTTTTDDMDRHDNTGKWGLLGLVGLVGLVNMRRNEKPRTYTSTNTPPNR